MDLIVDIFMILLNIGYAALDQKKKLLTASHQSFTSKSSSTHEKGQKRLLGASTASDPRVAHYGCVTGLQITYDGLYLLSSGFTVQSTSAHQC